MKICFFNVTATTHTGGLETYCWEVGHALASRGHRVDIVCGKGGVARRPDVGLVQFPFTHRSRYPNFGNRFRKFMERLSFGRQALPHLLAADYDAVVINKPYDFPVIWRAKRRGMRAQVVFRSGGTDFFAGDRLFASSIDHWASSSGYNARQIEARYGRKVTVMHNGVDTDAFTPGAPDPAVRAAWGVPREAVLLVSVGRVVGWKGLQVVIEALPAAPGVHFVAIGDGPDRARLESLAQSAGVGSRVHFAGTVPHRELPRALRAADLLVQPSIGEEAFGISVVEAMACGLPALASRNGGLPEIVVDGETGLLLPTGEVNAWARAIAELAAAPERRRAMGEASRLRVESEFTWIANALQLEQVLSGAAPCAA